MLQPPISHVYLRLRFRDPQGTIRDFPPNYPVRIRFGDGATAQTLMPSPPVQPGGRFNFIARTTTPWQYFTLEFPAAGIPYIVCEPMGSPPASPPHFSLAPGLPALTGHGQRFFSLPKQWELRQADWSPPPAFVGNGRFDAPNGRIYHTLSPPNDISIGTPANPVVLTLEPHWHFTRFEYYDRYYGNGHLDSPPRPSIQKRISIPQIAVEGLRNDPNAAASPPDTHSNWAIDLGAGSLLQSLPFILQRTAAGVVLSPPLDGAHLGLRFHHAPNTVVYSQTNAQRVIAVSPPPAAPGPDRLRYYDLPPLWKSRRYYTRRLVSSPPSAGKFFHLLTAAEITQAESTAHPLVFSLDDMVLYSAAGAALSPLPALAAADRVTIFGHRFTNELPNSGPQGLYKDMPAAAAASPLDLPFSNVPTTDNYLFDYPDWTRLVVAQGNLFDVFDRRSPDSATATRVVGARAAVRWVDTGAPPGIAVFNSAGNPAPAATALAPTFSRSPGFLGQNGNYPARFDSAPRFFSLQPFYGQYRPDSRFNLYAAANAPLLRGRFDIALLRCCDVEDNVEVAVNLHYIKSFFNFISPPPSPPGFAYNLNQNVMNRWSGNETGAGISQSRVQLLAQTSPPGLRSPKTMVVWYCQSVPNARAHCAVDVKKFDTSAPPASPPALLTRANRETIFGGGESGPTNDLPIANQNFASAHECGHMDGMPDEYNERWQGESYNEISVRQNLPGDPYESDDGRHNGSLTDRGIMVHNRMMRNRYFWHAAEWVRQIYGTPMRVRLDATFDNYTLPPFLPAAQRDRAYYPWPMQGALNQSNPANPQSRFDLYLHALGKDRFSGAILPGSSPPLPPFDGMLIVIVRLNCNLPPDPNRARETVNRQTILSSITAAVRNQLNNRWFATGTANYGSPATPHRFNKCLIEFRASVVVTNHPFNARSQANANSIVSTFTSPPHYTLQVTSPPTSPPASPWASPPTRILSLYVSPPGINPGPAFIAQFPRMLGIPSPPPPPPGVAFPAGAMNSPHIQAIARLIMPDAVITRFQ